ncbi:Rhomboid protease GlpG [bioreactor metagenome]|uniref:Rhomboid protease GlpG n=1 Tax=bioreactor metagenome TaxID=1076179 RepID=A0A644XKK1_9ZZZZ
MKNFEKIFFGLLTKELNFFMRSYYSEFHKEERWIGLIDLNEVVVSVVVSNDMNEEVDFNEAKEYLLKSLNKRFVVNLIILASEEYINYNENNYYNKLIFSVKDKKILYSSEGSKAFIPIINYMINENNKKKINFKKYKVTYTVIILNILVYLIEIIKSRNLIDINIYTLIQMGAKINILINRGEIYRLITSTFLHGGIMHILFNMSALNIIGKEVEYIYGSKKYILIYILSALSGSLFSYLFNPNSVSVGASGAIFGLLGAMLVFGLKEKNKIGKQYVKNILETLAINVIIGITISNIDNYAHLGGLIMGALSALILFKSKKTIS